MSSEYRHYAYCCPMGLHVQATTCTSEVVCELVHVAREFALRKPFSEYPDPLYLVLHCPDCMSICTAGQGHACRGRR